MASSHYKTFIMKNMDMRYIPSKRLWKSKEFGYLITSLPALREKLSADLILLPTLYKKIWSHLFAAILTYGIWPSGLNRTDKRLLAFVLAGMVSNRRIQMQQSKCGGQDGLS